MILVDVYMPAFDKAYDFNLREDAKVQIIIEEIVEMIVQKERTGVAGNISALALYDRLEHKQLSWNQTLKACGIHNGSSLILV